MGEYNKPGLVRFSKIDQKLLESLQGYGKTYLIAYAPHIANDLSDVGWYNYACDNGLVLW